MSNKKLFYLVVIFIFGFSLFGCSASTVEERRGEIPKEKEQIDTLLIKAEENKEPEKVEEKDQQVNIENEEIKKEESKIEPTLTKNVFYTVQLGAFQKISNVEKFEKVIKAKFPNLPLKTEQDTNTGYYKVTVGKFETKDEAYRLRDYCVQQGYKDAWVTELSK